VELGHEGVVGVLVDESDLYIGIVAEMLFKLLASPDAAIAAAQNKDFLLLRHSYLLPGVAGLHNKGR